MSRTTTRTTSAAALALAAAGALLTAGCGGGANAASTPKQQSAAPTTTASPVAANGDATITSCGTAQLGVPAADVRITNKTQSAADYTVTVSFANAAGKHLFDGVNFDDPVAAGKTGQFTVVGSPTDPSAKIPAKVTCTIAKVQRAAAKG